MSVNLTPGAPVAAKVLQYLHTRGKTGSTQCANSPHSTVHTAQSTQHSPHCTVHTSQSTHHSGWRTAATHVEAATASSHSLAPMSWLGVWNTNRSSSPCRAPGSWAVQETCSRATQPTPCARWSGWLQRHKHFVRGGVRGGGCSHYASSPCHHRTNNTLWNEVC